MRWTDGPGPRPDRSVAELLELVHAKAKAGRRRTQWRVVTVLCAVVVVGVASVMSIRASSGDRRSRLQLADPAITTTSAVTQPTSTTTSAATQPTSTRMAAAGPPPSLPGAGCRNSTNPECGPFTWDPAPDPDQPLTVNVTYAPVSPRAGEEVTFTVIVEDPDARVMRNFNNRRDYGDGVVDDAPPFPASCGQAFGPWTPPVKVPDRLTTTFQHVYTRAGTYTASFSFESTSGCVGGDPYGSRATGSVTVDVAP